MSAKNAEGPKKRIPPSNHHKPEPMLPDSKEVIEFVKFALAEDYRSRGEKTTDGFHSANL